MLKLHLADAVAKNYYTRWNSEIHVKQQLIVDYVYSEKNRIPLNKRFKYKIITALNDIALKLLQGDNLDDIGDIRYFIENASDLEELSDAHPMYHQNILTYDEIDWEDINTIHENESDECDSSSVDNKTIDVVSSTQDTVSSENSKVTRKILINRADKPIRQSKMSDIWLKPRFPQFDVNDIWLEGEADGNYLVIRKSLPRIPKVQSDISITTEFDDLNDEDFLKLFPNTILKPRFEKLYYDLDGRFKNVKNHPVLGNLIMIDGYSYDQIVDNVIRYPHFYNLKRVVDGKWVNFYTKIEIDGELYPITEVWNDLSESKGIPTDVHYMKEYVIRRYLLERDVQGINHNYPLWGSLNPFITLFAPIDTYKELGYTDCLEISKQCVKSRINFYYTRNPIVRRLLKDE